MSFESLLQSGAILVAVLAAFALSSLGARVVERRLVKAPRVDLTVEEPSLLTADVPVRDAPEPTTLDSPAAPVARPAPVRWHSREISRHRSAEGARHKT